MVRRKASESPFAIYCWFLQVLIVLSMVAVVIWLITKPRNPKFTITAIQIPKSGNRSLTKVQQNETLRNNSVDLDLQITNPNSGITICYILIDVKLYNGGVLCGSKSLGSFCQGQRKTVTEEVLIDADREFRAGNAGGGAVLRVTVETMVRFHSILSWKTKVHHLGFEGFVRIGNEGNLTEKVYLHKIPLIH
ncbi:unnamed protein product [Lactuca virosa]|uniref:Late embryogenesis abundant protein LEA-2 subgroup domain-containing protein n=1 Tax=Lactuca virosa TaxID=75947 RepID=A0AAU9PEV4_9ASTR|nr:unnamed protein product [Lactuca virosa]